jgi:hypothetical protein
VSKGKKVYVRMSDEMHAAAKQAADSVMMPLSNWIVLRVAQGIRNWQDPLTGKRAVPQQEAKGKYDGWVCGNPACPGSKDANLCQRVKAHQSSWWNPETGEQAWPG